MKAEKRIAPGTILLAAANVIVFFYLTFQGMTEDGAFMLEHGAMYVPYVLGSGEYYRLFSSMFMHFGFEHLVNNMVMLLVIGFTLERELGTIKFFDHLFAQWAWRKSSVCGMGYDVRKLCGISRSLRGLYLE